MKFQIKRAKDKQWYYILIARNGQVILTSETYKRRASCFKGIASLRLGTAKAPVIDNSKTK